MRVQKSITNAAINAIAAGIFDKPNVSRVSPQGDGRRQSLYIAIYTGGALFSVYFVVLWSSPSQLIGSSEPQRPEDTKSNLAIRPSFPYILCLTIATQNPEAMLLRSALGEESTWLATTTRFVTLFLGRAARCDRTQQYASSENAGRMLTCPARFRDGFGRTISKRLHVGDETTKAQCTQSQAATEFAQSIGLIASCPTE